jgi:hypothetical protein
MFGRHCTMPCVALSGRSVVDRVHASFEPTFPRVDLEHAASETTG